MPERKKTEALKMGIAFLREYHFELHIFCSSRVRMEKEMVFAWRPFEKKNALEFHFYRYRNWFTSALFFDNFWIESFAHEKNRIYFDKIVSDNHLVFQFFLFFCYLLNAASNRKFRATNSRIFLNGRTKVNLQSFGERF